MKPKLRIVTDEEPTERVFGSATRYGRCANLRCRRSGSSSTTPICVVVALRASIGAA